MEVLYFGKLHKKDCVELSTTNDWTAVEDIAEETLEAIDVQECSVCLE